MRQGWLAKVSTPVFAPHLTRSERLGVAGETPQKTIPAKTRTLAPVIADVTGATLISDGRLARARSCAWMYARARHSGQTLSGCPPGWSSRPQLTQVAIHELYDATGNPDGPDSR